MWEINNKLIKVREASIYSLRRYVAQKTNRNPREVEELINKLVIQYENSNFCFSGRAYKSLLARIVGRNVSNDEIQEIIARIDKNYRAFKNKIDDNQQ